MGMIRVDEAQAGMVLAAEVRDRMGRLLMTAGQELSDRALRVFRMWGVTEIHVEGRAADANEQPAEEIDTTERARLHATAEDLFRHVDRAHPAAAELFRLSVRHMPLRGDA